MTGKDLQKQFEMKLWTMIPETQIEAKLDSDTIFYWLNEGVTKFIESSFNGYNPTRTSYEQNEKRTRDLVNLFVETKLEPVGISVYKGTDSQGNKIYEKIPVAIYDTYDSTKYIYPEELMFVLNEDVCISDNSGDHKYDTCVFECTADNFMYRINNSLTDFHYKYHKARPLRVRTEDGCCLLTDKNYKIQSYRLGYLRKPKKVTADYDDNSKIDFQDYIWTEIVDLAV